MTKAQEAIRHILDRVVSDVNFAWYMFGTQSLALCYESEAERTGSTPVAVRAEIEQRTRGERLRTRIEKPDVKIAEDKLESIREMLSETDGFYPAESEWDKLYSYITDLVE